MFIFPMIATGISLIFSLLVFRQYFQRRKPYQLAWAVALLMFGIASLMETIATVAVWNELLVKTWYLFGAMLVVGYLALGSLYVADKKVAARLLQIGVVVTLIGPVLPMVVFSKGALASEKITAGLIFGIIAVLLIVLTLVTHRPATIWLWTLIGASIGSAVMLINAPFHQSKVAALVATNQSAWLAMDRTLLMKATVASINTLGTVILAGGALYSAWVLFRKHILKEVATGNILIGIGALINGIGGFASGYFQIAGPALLSILLAIGITVMFFGFLETGRQSTQSPPKKTPVDLEKNQPSLVE